jgi:hypothetical protein
MSREHRPEDYLEALCGALSEGMPRATACRLAGLRPSVLDRWLAEGEAGNPRFQGAAEEILAAEAVGHATLWRDIRGARDWKAKLALLKAADPSTYNEKSTVDVAVTSTVLQSVQPVVLEAELVRRLEPTGHDDCDQAPSQAELERVVLPTKE